MDLRQLRYFVAVAERGGFGAAASALNVAQSALSRHIRVLEEELGGALLVRGTRGVSVTESGKVLLDRGRWLLGSLDDIKAEVQTENREPSGTVRLGAPSSLAVELAIEKKMTLIGFLKETRFNIYCGEERVTGENFQK